MAGIVGIDLGSKNCVIAIVEKGGIEIVTNEVSNRSTPVLVGFGEKERYIGEPALNLIKSNFRNTIQFPTRFLGIGSDYQNLSEELIWMTSKVVNRKNKKLGFEVKYKQQTCIFSCEEIVAMFLQRIKITLQSTKRANNDLCISVPCYLSQIERQALLDACKIADINCLKLMNNDTAIALSYGLFRQKELTKQPRIVCFVDMGHSKTTVTLVNFTREKLVILARAYDRDLGGRNFDYQLMQKFAKDFESKYFQNPLDNPKAFIRMQEQIEKLKKILSSNTEGELNIESLLGDNDLSATFTREKFENLCKPYLLRFEGLLQKVTQGFDKSQIHSVEIVGGSTRIPAVLQILKHHFNLDVSRTLQATECIARGCAVQAAILSPTFKVKEYGIEDISSFSISVRQSENSSPSELFPLNSKFPQIKTLQFNKQQAFELEAFYPNWNNKGIDNKLGLYKVNSSTSEDNLDITVFTKLNMHCMFEVENAEQIERYEEEIEESVKFEERKQEKEKEKYLDIDLIEIASNPEIHMLDNSEYLKQKQEQSPLLWLGKTNKKRKRVRKLIVDILSEHGMTNFEIQESCKRETIMEYDDKIEKETAERKNELESYIYNMRNNLSSIYAKYVSYLEKQQFQLFLQDVESWINEQGSEASQEEYLQKLEWLKTVGDRIERRYQEYQLIPQEIQKLKHLLQYYLKLCQSQDTKYEHISQIERKKLLDEIIAQDKWISNAFKKQEAISNEQDPVISSQEVKFRSEQITKLGNAIMSKPKPKPQSPTFETESEVQILNQQGSDEQEQDSEISQEYDIDFD